MKMPWYCKGCGRRRGGTECKKSCVEKYGNLGADRVPPLDGMVFINDDGTYVSREEQQRLKRAVFPDRVTVRYEQGPRPPGWEEAMRTIAVRCELRLEGGVSIPEC